MHYLDYLNSRGLFTVKLGLERIESLCREFGEPQESFKTIHIAGTNGKGSVASMIASVLHTNGFKVGFYTSPHLVDFNERIQVNGQLISDDEIESLLEMIKPHVTDHTFFEITTAMAFMYFKEQNVDYAVIEVGLGGRLDATNVIKPDVTVITNISKEHTQFLGKRIKDIAREKAGIIKPGVPVVTGCTGSALRELETICKVHGSALHQPEGNGIMLNLRGSFQKKNAQIARKALEVIGITDCRDGLLKARWPGRMHMVKDNVLFDCAHNPAAAKVLARELKHYGKVNLVLGMMRDKDIRKVCRILAPIAGQAILTRAKIARSAQPDELSPYFKNPLIIQDIRKALKASMHKPGLTVLTGSIFVVGEGFSALSLKPFDSKIY